MAAYELIDHEYDVVVVGAGPTGVELAGALSEIGRLTVARDFRNFDPAAVPPTRLAAGDLLQFGVVP